MNTYKAIGKFKYFKDNAWQIRIFEILIEARNTEEAKEKVRLIYQPTLQEVRIEKIIEEIEDENNENYVA